MIIIRSNNFYKPDLRVGVKVGVGVRVGVGVVVGVFVLVGLSVGVGVSVEVGVGAVSSSRRSSAISNQTF